MIEQNKAHPPVLESVAQMIVALRDLDDATALNVLAALEPVEQSEASSHIAWMFIYFALFREQHFKELPPFDPTAIREQFKGRLRDNRLRGTSIAHFFGLLSHEQVEFDVLVPYLELIVAGKTDKYVNNRFYQLAASQSATHPAEIGKMMETVMDGELRALAGGSIHEIWCPKDFARTIEALEKAGPEHQERVARLRQRMEPSRDRIHSMFDF